MPTSAIEKIINLISPYECLVCGKQEQLVCNDCWCQNTQTKTPTCFWCNCLSDAGKTCKRCRVKTHLSGVIIPYRLTGVIKDCIYELKYYSNREAARLLAKHVYRSISQHHFDYVSFVPATGKNQRKRGYNQARLLAKEISNLSSIPLITTLYRHKHIDQIGLNRSQRLEAVKNNFEAAGKYLDKNILLVDDVITTGATLDECARMIKNTGAKQVWGVAIAKK